MHWVHVDYEPHLHFLPSGFYWYFAVVVIVAAHVVAVLVAHRHLATSSADRAALMVEDSTAAGTRTEAF